MAQPRAEIPDARLLRVGEQGGTPLAAGGSSLLWPWLRAGRWPLAGWPLAVRSVCPSEQTEKPGLMPLALHGLLPRREGRLRRALTGVTLGRSPPPPASAGWATCGASSCHSPARVGLREGGQRCRAFQPRACQPRCRAQKWALVGERFVCSCVLPGLVLLGLW